MAGRAPSAAPIRLTMTVCFAVPTAFSRRKRAQALAGYLWPTKKPDIDNTMKLCDALNGVVWIDDKQVVSGTVHKIYGDRPGLVLEVETLAEHPAAVTGNGYDADLLSLSTPT